MDGWSLFGRTQLVALCDRPGCCSQSLHQRLGKKSPQQRRDEISGITLHVPIPVPALAELYAGIHRDFLPSDRWA